MADDNPLVKEVYLDASPELVFRYLTERDKMLRWLGLTVEIDPRPGGTFRMDPNGRELIRGEYLEVIPSRRIVFTWGWERGNTRVPAGSTIVEIESLRGQERCFVSRIGTFPRKRAFAPIMSTGGRTILIG